MTDFLDHDFSLPVEAYTTMYSAPNSLAALFEKHTAGVVRDRPHDRQRPRHRLHRQQQFQRPLAAVPRSVSQTPTALVAAGLTWEPWMSKDTPKSRRIVNALLNPHAYTRTMDACVQCTLDGVPCMLDLGVAPHEGIPCASCRGVRCTFKTQARRGSREPREGSGVNRGHASSSISSVHAPMSSSSSPPREEVRTPSTSRASSPAAFVAPPFLTPIAQVSQSLSFFPTAGPALYQPSQPCVGCHASSQPCIIAAGVVRDGPLPPCGCCSVAGVDCLFVFARQGWAHLSPAVMRGDQATWIEGCAGFSV